MTGTGHSPLRPYMACSKSACSVLVGKPVLGPPRCTLMITSGSSVITARPMASLFSAMPGPLEAVTAMAPPNAAPMAEVTAAISSSAWKRADAEVLVPHQLVQDVAGRRDRVAAVEQLAAAALGGRHQAPGQGLVAGDVAIQAGGQLGLVDRVLAGHGVGRFAVVVAGLQGPAVGLGHGRHLAELFVDVAQRRLERAVVEPEDQAHGVEVAAAVALLLAQAQAFDGQTREPGHLDRKQLVAVEAAVFQRDWSS